ncbi:MAG TPA: DNA/RNA nuclease SfsA [Geoalkalibacter subterraneus]|uniref:Sugar fermentation stimulation protein homolog n=1 Tax=Geoalkalibacter subterraneus TaxID=483547 RepID=A0A831LK72_9BACT|nr:DNA/RNA nuclease SfsA [Geoalkalibacter subterraneus]
MKLPQPLVAGILRRRYQRFLAEVELEDGSLVTAHTPNTGSMRQCAVPGHRVLLSRNDNPRRKLRYTLELIEVDGSWVDTHTHRANQVVGEALHAGLVAGLDGCRIRPEYRYGASRLDFFLERGETRILLEVKNVTLMHDARTACFPDAVTVRGQKHLRELMSAVAEGLRGIIFFVVQRAAAEAFTPADDIDPEYGRLLREAAGAGVEIMAWRTRVSPEEVCADRPLPVVL